MVGRLLKGKEDIDYDRRVERPDNVVTAKELKDMKIAVQLDRRFI